VYKGGVEVCLGIGKRGSKLIGGTFMYTVEVSSWEKPWGQRLALMEEKPKGINKILRVLIKWGDEKST